MTMLSGYKHRCTDCDKIHSQVARYCPHCGHKRTDHFAFQNE